jgi:hypothetical protein
MPSGTLNHEPVTGTFIGGAHVELVQTYARTVPVHAFPVKLAESQWLSLSQFLNEAGPVAWSHFQGAAPLTRQPLADVAVSLPALHEMAGGDGAGSADDGDDAAARTRPAKAMTLTILEIRMGFFLVRAGLRK